VTDKPLTSIPEKPNTRVWLFPLLAISALSLVWYFLPHPALIVVIGIMPFALLFTLKQPFLLVLCFVIFSFFRIHEVFPQIYNFKIPLLLSMASLGALFWHLALSAKITPYWRPELSAISLFFLLVIIGLPLASNRAVAIAYFSAIYWKIIVMTFAIAWLSRRAQDFALASRLITLSGLLVGIVALSNKAQGIGLVEETRVTIGRAIGSVLGDPNDLALVLMFPVAFALSLMLSKGVGRLNTALGLISTPILFFAVIATQSRGGLLGIMSIYAVFAYRRMASKMLFFGLGGAASMLVFLLAGISERSSGGAAEGGIDQSAMGRLYAWEAATGMAQHNPLSGVGLNNFYSNYFYYSQHWDGLNHAVHSTWFGVLAETGFLGLSVFLATIGLLIKTALQTLKRIEAHPLPVDPAIHATAQAVLAGLLGTVISATFLTQGFTWPIYILLALVVALAQWVDTHLFDSPSSSD